MSALRLVAASTLHCVLAASTIHHPPSTVTTTTTTTTITSLKVCTTILSFPHGMDE